MELNKNAASILTDQSHTGTYPNPITYTKRRTIGKEDGEQPFWNNKQGSVKDRLTPTLFVKQWFVSNSSSVLYGPEGCIVHEPKCKQITRAWEEVPGSSLRLCLHMEDRRTILACMQ